MTHPVIKIHVRDFGTMTAELYPEKAPLTVANFLSLIEKDFFSGLIFHRVIKGFMIQGGGYDDEMTPKETDAIKGEFKANGYDNPLSHTRGAVSMARSQAYNSASSQFFIVQRNFKSWDGQYAVFGYVTEGMEIVDKICAEATPMDSNGLIMVEQRPRIQTIKVEPIQ